MSSPVLILPFHYQSGDISLHDWLQLFTLCLAPLVLHVVTGVPEPTVLDYSSPSWWDRLPFFNPVSILWRYHAIADRRARLRHWSKEDMAISNAVFWINKGWHGSEPLLDITRGWITKGPPRSHVSFISASTLTTLALALQGIHAFIETVEGSLGTDSVNRLFSPVALFSLLRLPAALWLSNEYVFAAWENKMKTQPALTSTSTIRYTISARPMELSEMGKERRLLGPAETVGVCYRVWWVLSMATLFSLACYIGGDGILWNKYDILVSVSDMFERVFYFCLAAGGLFIHAAYVIPGGNTTTVLPCIQMMWYKLYTCLIIVLAILAFVCASLETHQCEGGIFTTYSCNLVPEV